MSGNPRPKTKPVPRWSSRGPSLFAHLYLALAVQSSLLVYSIYGSRPNHSLWMWAMLIAFPGLAWLTALARELFHDWLVTITLAGKFWLAILIAVSFGLPGLFRGHYIIPEGFALILIPLLPFAVIDTNVRLYIALTIVGFSFALAARDTPPELGLVLGFGATTLWSLACAHFAFTGTSFGLRGWGPIRRILFNVALYFGPAALASWITFTLWPAREGNDVRAAFDPSQVAVRPAPRPVPPDLASSLLRLALYLLLIIGSLFGLYLLRRYLSKRSKAIELPQVRMIDVGGVEMRESDPKPEEERLRGVRGQILALWWRWAREARRDEFNHQRGETAAELAEHVTNDNDDESNALMLTRIMEASHYGPDEPGRQDLERMKSLVKVEIERMKS